jgi:protein-tyrosine phosphatase
MILNAYDKICDNLYLGNKDAALNTSQMFTLIVNCTKTEVDFPPNCTNCIRIPVDDTPDESDSLLQLLSSTHVLQNIHNHMGPVLVHCRAGRQRSCAVVACYLIRYYNMTPIQAVSYIKSKRPEAFFGSINFANTINHFYTTI